MTNVLYILIKYKIGSLINNQAACHIFIGINVHHKNGKKKKIEQESPTFLHPDNAVQTSKLNNP